MSYFDDYNDRMSKIPYDEVPITRNEQNQRAQGYYRGGMKTGKFATMVISFMLIVNFVLTFVCLSLITNMKVRTVNNYVVEVGGNAGVSSAIKNSALLSSCAVASGGNCSTAESFYNQSQSRGSGVIYRVDKNPNNSQVGTIYFVTCYHVVSGYTNNVYVMMSSSLAPLKVDVLAYSSHYDLAVLKCEVEDNLDLVLNGCKAVSVFDSVYTTYGEKVFAIGNSLACGLSITDGVISQLNTEVKISKNYFYTRTLQISAEINPGNSGGGLFNEDGEFIGIVNAKRHTADSNGESFTVVGTSYAIPSSIVRGVADSLISGNQKPTRVDIGLSFEHNEADGKRLEVNDEYDGNNRLVDKYTVLVSSIKAGSPFYGSQLEVGDEITAIEFYERGSTISKKVTMFNKFIFEDYAFSIQQGSDFTIYYKKAGAGDEKSIKVKVNSVVTVSD